VLLASLSAEYWWLVAAVEQCCCRCATECLLFTYPGIPVPSHNDGAVGLAGGYIDNALLDGQVSCWQVNLLQLTAIGPRQIAADDVDQLPRPCWQQALKLQMCNL
jgi:hypothetical protein